jgi:hypothetical protein
MNDSFVIDPEIINVFQQEANTLLVDLRQIIEKLEDVEDDFPKELLEEFGNKTDRIMGTATTFTEICPGHPVLIQIGNFCELCKVTSYKASTLNDANLIPIFTGFWADTVDMLQELVTNVNDPQKVMTMTRGYIPTLHKRLLWLAEQIVAIYKNRDIKDKAIINVDGLLKKLGVDVE